MLTLQFLTYAEIEKLTPGMRIKRILDIVRGDKILLLEGRLAKEEEAELIKSTMETINDHFKGVELLVLSSDRKQLGVFGKLQNKIIEMLSGTRQGITIIGPATIVKEIKKDPDKIQLLTVEGKKMSVKKKKKKLMV